MALDKGGLRTRERGVLALMTPFKVVLVEVARNAVLVVVDAIVDVETLAVVVRKLFGVVVVSVDVDCKVAETVTGTCARRNTSTVSLGGFLRSNPSPDDMKNLTAPDDASVIVLRFVSLFESSPFMRRAKVLAGEDVVVAALTTGLWLLLTAAAMANSAGVVSSVRSWKKA